jgi:hypothetical protein
MHGAVAVLVEVRMVRDIGIFLTVFGLGFKALWLLRVKPPPGSEEVSNAMMTTSARDWPRKWKLQGPTSAVAAARVLRWPNRLSVPLMIGGIVLLGVSMGLR